MNTAETVVDHRLELLRRHLRRPGHSAVGPGTPEIETPVTIALSREAGAGGLEIAHEIGRRLSWRAYDHEILELIAKEVGLRTELMEPLDEHDPDWLTDMLSSFGKRHHNSASYVHHLVQVVAALASRGHCILVGRGASAILNPKTTLRVRVIADREDRQDRVARRMGISRVAAAAEVRRIDRDRQHFVASHFHQNVADPRNYDLVLNSSRLGVLACAQLAANAAQAFRVPRPAT